jgi:hypothetical protein
MEGILDDKRCVGRAFPAHDGKARMNKGRSNVMFTFIIIFCLLSALDLAASRWGVDSTETFDSPEWERRMQQLSLRN